MDNQDDKLVDNKEEQQIKKPSVLSQLIPYVFTAAILAWVFTGLSSSVVDERHKLTGSEWETLIKSGARIASVEVKSLSGATVFCGAILGQPVSKQPESCAGLTDYELKQEGKDKVTIRRTAGSRIQERTEVSIDYVQKVRLSEIWAIVRAADLRLFLPVMIFHTLMFFFADVFSFGLAYRFFNVPGMRYKEIMECRGAPYVIQVGLAALAEGLFPLYMLRVKKVPVTETLSSNIWTIIMDTAAIATMITPAVIYNIFFNRLIPVIGYPWLIVCIVYWTLLLGNIIFWHTARGHRAADWIAARRGQKTEEGLKSSMGGGLQLLRTFSIAAWDQYLRVYLVRVALWISFFISNYVALRAMGINPPTSLAMIGIPLVVMAIFLPIGVGGYGGPQLIAWFIFVKIGQAGTADQVIAFSLLYSTTFLIGRALVGLVFIRGFWRRCFS